MTDKSSVQKILRPSEFCRFVIDTKSNDAVSGKQKSRILAIVGDLESKKEFAIVLLKKKKKFGQIKIVSVMPVFKDLKIDTKDDLCFSLMSQARYESYTLQALKKEALEEMLDVITNILYIATQENFVPSGSSHAWTKHYQNMNIFFSPDDPIAANVQKSGGIVSSAKHGVAAGDDDDEDDAPTQKDPRATLMMARHENDDFLQGRLRQREAEFIETQALNVFCGTWNVNTRRPGPDEPLSKWLKPAQGRPAPDIYALGFQEVDMSAEAVILNNVASGKPWEDGTEVELNKMYDNVQYDMVCSKQLAGILLIVFCRKELTSSITNVRADVAGVGILGVMGNKGGVAIRFGLQDSSLCFVNSHLAASHDNIQRRNEDFLEITRRIQFSFEGSQSLGMMDHDLVFWLGDLNYRIQMADDEVRSKIKAREWGRLQEFDQLNMQKKLGNCFQGFEEGPLDFEPTYKYDPGTDTYDTSEKKRTPAYCDRVLWKTSPYVDKLCHYNRAELKLSDHKPVVAILDVKTKTIIREKRNQIYREIVRDLDKLENDLMPDASISCNTFALRGVRYGVPCSESFVLENIGAVLARYRFIPKNNESAYCKPWLTVTPRMGTLAPGAKVTITLTVLIDDITAAALNSQNDKLEDILILSLQKGKHHFVTVTGEYLRSCFGMTLHDLVRMSEPARWAPAVTGDSVQCLQVPKELWRLVDYLYRNGLDKEGILVNGGNASEMAHIRECLDMGAEFDYNGSIHSVAEVFIRFLGALPDPVIPHSLYNKCLDNCNNYQQLKQIISTLPLVNYNVFIYLMSFLREVLLHREDNKLTADQLAYIFGSVMLRPQNRNATTKDGAKKRTAVLLHFITDDDQLIVA